MEIWDTSFCWKYEEWKEIEAYRKLKIQEQRRVIGEVYQFYVETMKNTSYSMNQICWMAYIEEYCREEFRTVINKSKMSFNGNIPKTIKYLNEYISKYNAKLPNFEWYQGKFIQRLNDMLGAIFGKNVDLSIFRCSDEDGYEIDEEDRTYLMFLSATYDMEDARYLIVGDYKEVSDFYYQEIRLGAETLVGKEKIPNMTLSNLNHRFDVVFGLEHRLREKRYRKKYEELKGEFQIVQSLIETCMNDRQEYEIAERRCNSCISILEDCQFKLLVLRAEIMQDAGITRSEFNKIMCEFEKRTRENMKERKKEIEEKKRIVRDF